MMAGRPLSYREGIFSGAMLNFGRVNCLETKIGKKKHPSPQHQHLLTDHASLGHRRLFLVTEGLGNAAGHVGQEATKLLHHDMSGWWLNQRIWNILVK